MSPVVVEVGPQAIRGPNRVAPESASVALECIDDDLALLDEQLVEVRRLWSDLLAAAAGQCDGTLMLLVPTWWSAARVELLSGAAPNTAADVVVLRRGPVLSADSAATVVEFGDEFGVIVSPSAETVVLARGERDITACLAGATEIVVDVPAGVRPPAPTFGARLQAGGAAVTFSDRRRLLRAAGAALPGPPAPRPGGPRSRTRRRVTAVLAGAAVSVAAVVGGWAAQVLSGQPAADPSSALLVEGRVGVRVPADWAVERITSGPGSARLRVSAPTGDATAIHVTQSTGASPETLVEVAESLRRALEAEPAGVFTDFDPAARIGGRPAVSYRELRAGSETTWAVVIDGAVRIAVGCQRPSRVETIDDACVHAVRSAQVVR